MKCLNCDKDITPIADYWIHSETNIQFCDLERIDLQPPFLATPTPKVQPA